MLSVRTTAIPEMMIMATIMTAKPNLHQFHDKARTATAKLSRSETVTKATETIPIREREQVNGMARTVVSGSTDRLVQISVIHIFVV